MEEIVKEYIDKGVEFAEQFIAKYGQAAWETVLTIKRMEAMQDMAINAAIGLLVFLGFSLSAFSIYKFYKVNNAFTKAVLDAESEAKKFSYSNKEYEPYRKAYLTLNESARNIYDLNKKKIKHCEFLLHTWMSVCAASSTISFTLFIILLVELLSIWEWIGYWYPDVVVAREVMMRLK